MPEDYDVIIIGTGAGGGTPAHTLAPSGKRVLLLERGTEDLPMHDSRVTVDKAANDHLAYKTSNDEEAEGIYDELQTVLNHVGLARPRVFDKNFYMTMNILIAGVAHQAGTGRFGTGPASSVSDVNGKAHDLDNLYVVDTSFFPSIGAVNPALTAIANAIRVGEHPAERLG